MSERKRLIYERISIYKIIYSQFVPRLIVLLPNSTLNSD